MPSPQTLKAVALTVATVALAVFACATIIVGTSPESELESTSQILGDGLKVVDVKEGDGPEPQIGEKIKVHYTGKLKDGQVFDSGDISFAFGQGQVIKGWDQGLRGMRQGGERKLVIPPELAYGKAGTPGGPIPPDATLYFDVKLLRA